MKIPLIVILAFQLACPAVFAAGVSQKREEHLISKVFQRLTTAWRAGNRNAWAKEFTEDAYFVVWFELGASGNEQLAWDHQLIFDNFYADTAFDVDIRQVRFVKPDVALVQLGGFVTNADQKSPTAPYEIPTAVLERSDSRWKIVAFQNTPFVVDEYRAYGELRRFKKISAENVGQK